MRGVIDPTHGVSFLQSFLHVTNIRRHGEQRCGGSLHCRRLKTAAAARENLEATIYNKDQSIDRRGTQLTAAARQRKRLPPIESTSPEVIVDAKDKRKYENVEER